MRPEAAAPALEFASPLALAHEITIGSAVRAVLWAALPAGSNAWPSERAAARGRLQQALRAAGAEPVGLELVDQCATAGADIDFGSDEPSNTSSDASSDAPSDALSDALVAEFAVAAAADAVADTTSGEIRRWIAAAAINGLTTAAAEAATVAVAEFVGGGVPPAVRAAFAAAIHDADAIDSADRIALQAAGCSSECSGCMACHADITREDCMRVAAAARGLLTVAEIVLGAPSVERLVAAAFIATDETAAAAALELVRRADVPAGLALAAVYNVVLSGMISPASFGDFAKVASALASRLAN